MVICRFLALFLHLIARRSSLDPTTGLLWIMLGLDKGGKDIARCRGVFMGELGAEERGEDD